MDKHVQILAGPALIEVMIDRIWTLATQLSRTRTNSARHRRLIRSMRVETAAYRRALDVEQAGEAFDRNRNRRISRKRSPLFALGHPAKGRA